MYVVVALRLSVCTGDLRWMSLFLKRCELLPGAACLDVAIRLSICISESRCMSLWTTCGLLLDAAYTEVALRPRLSHQWVALCICLEDV